MQNSNKKHIIISKPTSKQTQHRLSYLSLTYMGKSDSVHTRIRLFQISYVCMREHESTLKACSSTLKSPPQC